MKCESCNKEHDGSYGSGRFCCRSCSNKRVHSKKTKEKISNSIIEHQKSESKEVRIERAKKASKARWDKPNAKKEWSERMTKLMGKSDKEIFCKNSKVSSETLKKRLLKNKEYKCEKCGISEWNKEHITLELEHKDGDRHNNERDNLELLCPNCHSQTTTFRGRNKNNKYKKVSDEKLLQALNENETIRQALIFVGMTPKGGNYTRCKNLLNKG